MLARFQQGLDEIGADETRRSRDKPTRRFAGELLGKSGRKDTRGLSHKVGAGRSPPQGYSAINALRRDDC
jgi:hypothetical protein